MGLYFSSVSQQESALIYFNKSYNIYLEKTTNIEQFQYEIGSILYQIGLAYFNQDKHNDALESFTKAYEIFQQVKTEIDDDDIIQCLQNLGAIHISLNNDSKAKEYILKAYELYINFYGENHVKLAEVLINLGIIYFNEGNDQKAKETQEKCIQIYKESYGENCPQLTKPFNNLALIYREQCNYQESIIYLEQSLYLLKFNNCKKESIAHGQHNLGVTYYVMGQYNKAAELCLEALQMKKELYPEAHSQLANSYNDIGLIYDAIGQSQLALTNYEIALKIYKQIYGDCHLQIAVVLNNIGLILQEQQKLNEALECQKESYQIRQKLLSENHQELSGSLNNIGQVYLNLTQYDQAMEYFKKGLSLLNSINYKHVLAANILNNIGCIYFHQQNDEKTLEYYYQAAQLKKKLLEPTHPEFGLILKNIGYIFFKQEKYDVCIKYYEKAYEINILKFGEIYFQNEELIYHIAQSYKNIGQLSKALEYFQKSLSLWKTFQPSNYYMIQQFLHQVGAIQFHLQDYENGEITFKNLIKLQELEKPNSEALLKLLSQLAYEFYQREEYSKCIVYIFYILKIYKKILEPNDIKHADFQYWLGNILHTMQSKKISLKYIQQAYMINSSITENSEKLEEMQEKINQIKEEISKEENNNEEISTE